MTNIAYAFVAILCFIVVFVKPGACVDSLEQKCAEDVPKVSMCLPFATGKANVPTSQCCGVVTDLRKSDPACMCFIIQQVHNGSNPAIKSMGVQEARLLQLPSACKVANASISECPGLLHLAPNSPDAAIFLNNSTNAASTTPVVTPATSSPQTASSTNQGSWVKPQIFSFLILAIVIFVSAFH